MTDIAKMIADDLSEGYADNDAIGDEIGLYDSNTGKSLKIEHRVTVQTEAGPVSLVYTTARRGRICQVRRSNLHIHYFFDEGRAMIDEDEERNGVGFAQIIEHAPVPPVEGE